MNEIENDLKKENPHKMSSLETVKDDLERVLKEKLNYINEISKKSSQRILTESEKLEIYRNLNRYQTQLNSLYQKLERRLSKERKLSIDHYDDVLIKFDVGKDYLSSLKSVEGEYRKYVFDSIGINIDTYQFCLTIEDLLNLFSHPYNVFFNSSVFLNNQYLIDNTIYVFDCYYDYSDEEIGPIFKDSDEYLYGIYADIRNYSSQQKIAKKDMEEFEKTNTVIHTKKYVGFFDVSKLFEVELLNGKNKTIEDCVKATRKDVENLNHIRTPEYKEKLLLGKINELYNQVKGNLINREILYQGKFLDVLRETYEFPNNITLLKEKVVKNGGKDAVIVIATTKHDQYIITFQNRIHDTLIAEFPAGYIEENETPIEAAKRELLEETGYISNSILLLDQAYTSPGIDNSTTYIVYAKNCIRGEKRIQDSTELVNYGLFSELELKYLIDHNIMNGAMNKLAYYNKNDEKKILRLIREEKEPLSL